MDGCADLKLHLADCLCVRLTDFTSLNYNVALQEKCPIPLVSQVRFVQSGADKSKLKGTVQHFGRYAYLLSL